MAEGSAIIGVDPGLTGALALWRPGPRELTIEDVPTLELKRGKSKKRHVDHFALARILDLWCAGPGVVAYLELVGARPGEAPAYAFDFGRTYGLLLGVLAAQFIRVERVPPAVWKRVLKVPAAKDGARARASDLMPEHGNKWTRVKDDGRAEAALIALYGAQMEMAK